MEESGVSFGFIRLRAVGKYTNSEHRMHATQPIGHTRYRKVRFGTRGKMKYTQMNRNPHMKINVVTVGKVGLPIPRSAALKISLIPQMK